MSLNGILKTRAVAEDGSSSGRSSAVQNYSHATYLLFFAAAVVWFFWGWTWALIPFLPGVYTAMKGIKSVMAASKRDNIKNKKNNFELFYLDTIQSLFDNKKAGIPILILTFPILERYLRAKAGLSKNDPLNDYFYDELLKLFPLLKSTNVAGHFWQAYKDTIQNQAKSLHQASNENILSGIAVNSDMKESIRIEANGIFTLHPVGFASQVLHTVENTYASTKNDFSGLKEEMISKYGLPAATSNFTKPNTPGGTLHCETLQWYEKQTTTTDKINNDEADIKSDRLSHGEAQHKDSQ